jgi:hypothetical protein
MNGSAPTRPAGTVDGRSGQITLTGCAQHITPAITAASGSRPAPQVVAALLVDTLLRTVTGLSKR